MFFRRVFGWRSLEEIGARARREHSQYLTRAMLGFTRTPLPRIPTRRVDKGGFDKVMRDERGRRAADQWWRKAFESDLSDGE